MIKVILRKKKDAATINQKRLSFLKQKSDYVRKETLKIHRIAPQTRVASSLSAVDIFIVMYYGKILKFNPNDIRWKCRDRFIISKGHGAISLYPILADLGFFKKEELNMVCKEGSFLGGIPDTIIPGFETINGSLGHGLGVACGISLALKRKKRNEKVFVLLGDGELYEGSIWEAVMFAGEHKLDNLVVIVDNNKACMLDFCKNILDLEPLEDKFRAFKWDVKRISGHDIKQLYGTLACLKNSRKKKPSLLIADTVKGKGVTCLEIDALSHTRVLEADVIDSILARLK